MRDYEESAESALSQLAIPSGGRDVYYTRHRSEWLEKYPGPELAVELSTCICNWTCCNRVRQQARREFLAESRQHTITAKLRKIPSLGPIRSALVVALIQTPHRFHSKRQLWKYCGLALETRITGEYVYVHGERRRSSSALSSRVATAQ